MLGLFNDPFDILSYRPKYIARAYDPFYGYYQRPQRNYDPFGIHSLNAYMQAMGHVLNNLFAYDDQEELKRKKKNLQSKTTKSNQKKLKRKKKIIKIKLLTLMNLSKLILKQ